MTFTRVYPPLRIPTARVKAIGKVFPYNIWDYKDLGAEARAFLAESFPSHVGYLEVVGVSNHNGKGLQWGIILFRYPTPESEWEVVAHFGYHFGFRQWLAIRLWLMEKARWIDYANGSFDRPYRLENLTKAA